ncbi:MAG: ion channel, partial [Candidatus Dormibacteraceae bacterium]
MSWVEGVAGLVVIAVVGYDIFQSIVLPRPAVGRVRVSPHLVGLLWSAWRSAGRLPRRPERREAFLAAFAPGAVLYLLCIWALALVFGYGLLIMAVGGGVRPHPTGLGTALYLSAVSLFTLGFGDPVPVAVTARAVVVSEAAIGLGMVALVISLLFSLFSSFQRRESLVVTLDASAGAPPSGLQLLENSARLEMPELLAQTFGAWTQWSAEVLESHLAYPILVYFRSSHDNEAWVNSFGAVMDAAALVIAAVEGLPIGPARLFMKVGRHMVEDLGWYFRFPHTHDLDTTIEEFDIARARLLAMGYRLQDREPAWAEFLSLRQQYAPALERLGEYLSIAPAPWIGDR